MKKVLLLILGLLLFVNVSAEMLNNYNETINSVNNYIEKFNRYNVYIVTDDNIKFKNDDNTLSTDSNFKKGGLLNLFEFNISKGNGFTYLFNGQKYWTMTDNGSNSNAVTSYSAELKPKTDDYGMRVTEYVKNGITVSGSGTYGNPWEFSRMEYTVTFSANGGTVSPANKIVTWGLPYGALPTPTKSGSIFNGWYTSTTGGTKVTADTLVSLTRDHLIYAQWTGCGAGQYLSGGSCVACPKNTYSTGSANANCTACPTGYTTDSTGSSAKTACKITCAADTGVSIVDGQCIACEEGYNSPEHVVIAGQKSESCNANAYTLTANANGGSIGTSAGWTIASGNATATKAIVYDGTYGVLPTVTRSGYRFDGWYTAASGGTVVTADKVVKTITNQTIYAHWTACGAGQYLNGNTCTTCAAGTYSTGTANASCTTCDNGYYCNNGTRTACGAGKIGKGPGKSTESDACQTCAAGTYKTSQTTCSDCGTAYYCTGGESRQACPSGYTTSSTKSTAKSACYITCEANTLVTTADGKCTGACGTGYSIARHTVYASNKSGTCTANALTFTGNSVTKTFGTSAQTQANYVNEATNGTGTYTYAITAGNGNNYFSLSGRTLGIKASTPVGTYTLTIRVTDSNSAATKDATYTVIINKVAATITCANKSYTGSAQTIASCSGGTVGNASQTNVGEYAITCTGDSNHNNAATGTKCKITAVAATCPTVTAYSGNYDGSSHTITVSGGSGGTIQYSIDNSTWSTTKPTRTDAGTTTVYVRVSADSNHTTATCGNKAITINKVNATCPTVTAYSGNYNGSSHTITVSGGSGGTIQYSTDNSTWSTTKPTRTAAGTTTVYVRVAGDSNHNTITCGNKAITINKIAATITCANKSYTGSAQTIASCTGGTVGNASQTNVGEYAITCTGDSNHNNAATGTKCKITAVAATCPTVTAYSGNYDGSSHTVGISGGSGGTIQYSTDNSTWSATKPTRTAAGTTTVYVRVAGDSNHTTVTCGNKTIAINKVNATCPTVTAYSGNYDGNSHTVGISGGSGGTIQYSTDNSTWSATKPTRTAVGTTTVYVRVSADSNHNTVTCGNKNITIIQSTATVTYNCNGGGGSAPSAATVNIGSGATLSSRSCNYKITTGTSGKVYYQTGWSTSTSGSALSSYTVNGNVTLYATWAELFTITTSSYNVISDGSGNWRVELYSSGTFKANTSVAVDLHAVGGGGGGAGPINQNYGGSGGAGGKTATKKAQTLSATSYTVTVGTGGAGSVNGNASESRCVAGGNGTASSFGSLVSAAGGGGAAKSFKWGSGAGGSGGSGGGSGNCGQGQCTATGGTNGGNGTQGSKGSSYSFATLGAAGTGQGTTTRDFGETGGTLRAGGGGGGCAYGSKKTSSSSTGAAGGSGGGGAGGQWGTNGTVGTANYGGGGGGGGGSSNEADKEGSGGNGGTGIVIVRNKR